MKKPAWETMPVLDVRGITEQQLDLLEAAYDDLSKQGLAPLAQLAFDPVRQKIDDAISGAFGLPSFKPIRELLAREPGLTGRPINPRPTLDLDSADDGAVVQADGFPFEEHVADEE